MSDVLSRSGKNEVVSREMQEELVAEALARYAGLRRVLLVPPDQTRYQSGAGELTRDFHAALTGAGVYVDILPAIGTHEPMSPEDIESMYGDLPLESFHAHDWRQGVVRLGEVPGSFLSEVSDGRVDYPIAAEVDRLLVEGDYDLIVSIGQVVPHEVIGMANQNKNIFVGTGGQDTINKTHFLGAVCDMEKIMGRAETPVRAVFDWAEREFGDQLPPILYALTVRAEDAEAGLVTRGLWLSEGKAGFLEAARLSQQLNIHLLERRIRHAVVWLHPEKYRSTWIGSKALYRTRLAIETGGRLTIIAPGLKEFGEDREIDRLIRKYGYVGTERVLRAVDENEDLRVNLSAAAHLIHGSSEGRFEVVWVPGDVSREEIESVGHQSADIEETLERYDPDELREGWNTFEDGEEIYFIRSPGIGLWALREDFEAN